MQNLPLTDQSFLVADSLIARLLARQALLQLEETSRTKRLWRDVNVIDAR